MATAKELLAMSEVEIAERIVSQVTNSREYDQMNNLLSVKLALKNQESADRVAGYTAELTKATKNLAFATWGIAAITLITQIGLIVLTLKGK